MLLHASTAKLRNIAARAQGLYYREGYEYRKEEEKKENKEWKTPSGDPHPKIDQDLPPGPKDPQTKSPSNPIHMLAMKVQ